MNRGEAVTNLAQGGRSIKSLAGQQARRKQWGGLHKKERSHFILDILVRTACNFIGKHLEIEEV
jgi:hypothetical protein